MLSTEPGTHTQRLRLFLCENSRRVRGAERGGTVGGTFEVHQAVPVEVNVAEDLVHLPLAEPLSQPNKLFKSCSQSVDDCLWVISA